MTFASILLASALSVAAEPPLVATTYAGAAPAAAPAPAAPNLPGSPPAFAPISSAPVSSAPVASAPVSGCCGNSGVVIGGGATADCGCGEAVSHGHSKGGFFSRFMGGFGKKHGHSSDCGCAPAPSCGCAPAPTPSCGGCAPAPAVKAHGSCCAPAPVIAPAPVVHHAPAAPCGCGATAGACDPCTTTKHGHSGGGFFSFFGRKKSHGHGGDCGCGSVIAPDCGGCSSGCGSTTAAPSASVVPSAPIAPALPAAAGAPQYHGSPAPAALPPAIVPGPAAPAGKVIEPIQKLPAGDAKKVGAAPVEQPVIRPASAQAETGAPNPFDSDRRYDSRVAHAADYSSLTGQLTFVHADGGIWVLRYAPVSTEDANGGSVVLGRDRRMDSYREGDLVTVNGEVIDRRGSSRLGAPLYQVRTISLVERPSR